MSVSPLENLAVAIERGNARRVEALIHSGSIDVNARLPREFKPPLLVYAAKQMGRHARIRIVQLLLNAGARVDDADENGKTACHMAAWRNDDKVLRVLLAYRPNLAQRDRRGKIAPYTAVLLQYDDVEIALIGAGAPLDGVTLAERCRLAGTSVSAVETLMSRGVVISELRGDFDETPLHYAVMSESCSLALLNKLIACGVDVHALTTNWNQHANTCATLAIHQRNADALCIFLRAGTNEELYGDQLLHISVLTDNYECALALLAAGADVTARGHDGKTACILVAERARARISEESAMRLVHALLASGSDLDAADTDGNTARQLLAALHLSIDAQQVGSARREIAEMRLDFVRYRALTVCIGLQSLRLDALQMCEILQRACGPLARLIAFHHWWKIATAVKHSNFAKND